MGYDFVGGDTEFKYLISKESKKDLKEGGAFLGSPRARKVHRRFRRNRRCTVFVPVMYLATRTEYVFSQLDNCIYLL